MSISINTIDPCGKNVAKLLRAIAEYIDHNQKLKCKLDLEFVKEKETS